MTLSVESDANFARYVDPRASALVFPGLPGGGSQSNPYQAAISPAELLLAIGRATSAVADPTLGRFQMSAWWAVVRWYWALTVAGGMLTLAKDTDKLHNHHRQAFTEALGLGAGLLLVEHLLAGPGLPTPTTFAPWLIDIDSHWPDNRSRPDLLLVDPYSGPQSEAFILECKGNSGGRTASAVQLKSGIAQTLTLGGAARRLVIGVAAPHKLPTSLNAFAVEVDKNEPVALTRVWQELATGLPLTELGRLRRFGGIGRDVATPRIRQATVGGVTITGPTFTLPARSPQVQLTVGLERRVAEAVRSDEQPDLYAVHRIAAGSWNDARRHLAVLDGNSAEASASALYDDAEGTIAVLARDGCGFIATPLTDRHIDAAPARG